jgi:precorrin-3B C17-methyltransferase
MTRGALHVVGIGPGPAEWMTPDATRAVASATDIIGYRPYLARLAVGEHQAVHGSDNGDELVRARHALELAAAGAQVVVVSGGDPGVFAMAAAVFEAIEDGPPPWRSLDVTVLPGVTAMLAAAARLGAPLGNDFCTLNLSDNLKPWALIEKRLRLAAEGDFVIALYNPASKARPRQIHDAFSVLRRYQRESAVVMFAKAIGRPDEEVIITTLKDADPGVADMRTVVLVGSSATRCIQRPSGKSWVYSPRSSKAAM